MTVPAVRFATLDERQALEQLQLRASIALPTYRDFILQDPSVIEIPEWQFQRRRVRVVENDSVTVGFSVLLQLEEGISGLDGLFVEPDNWRRGFGSMLIRDASDMARSENARTMLVVANPDAVDFYKRCGFVTIGETTTQFGPAPQMQLDLLCG